jgi:nitroreductase
MIPVIDKEKCTDCRLCVQDCISRAITQEKKDIITHRCNLCSHCSAICPVEAISISGKTGEALKPLSETISDELESLIKRRRSIRHFMDKPVPNDEINRILNTVVHAPTGTNSRKVSITILNNREKITELTDIIMDHFDKVTKLLLNIFTFPLLILFLGRKKTKKLFSYKRYIATYGQGKNILTNDAPLLMIYHVDKRSSTPRQDGLIWATTAMYFAESLGIGTCFNGFLVIGINTCRKARKYLGIPKGNKICETFTAGYPQYTYKRSAVRDDLKVTIM